ncbi:hypothetical protein TetV_091 [Tetraselmis virus 1]|uniref:Uncharacterized protein n=1 Tax=Tetraselmis virus 1 TaxID=2060617 RepID=A0A2P0VMS2_9VIRU|nr:hypothetical protein QJ968_gp091 [Tetraselmis virus 1]AUF82183.1 hypothetical protein TetV_091 [Tetraselmis virus 1]
MLSKLSLILLIIATLSTIGVIVSSVLVLLSMKENRINGSIADLDAKYNSDGLVRVYYTTSSVDSTACEKNEKPSLDDESQKNVCSIYHPAFVFETNEQKISFQLLTPDLSRAVFPLTNSGKAKWDCPADVFYSLLSEKVDAKHHIATLSGDQANSVISEMKKYRDLVVGKRFVLASVRQNSSRPPIDVSAHQVRCRDVIADEYLGTDIVLGRSNNSHDFCEYIINFIDNIVPINNKDKLKTIKIILRGSTVSQVDKDELDKWYGDKTNPNKSIIDGKRLHAAVEQCMNELVLSSSNTMYWRCLNTEGTKETNYEITDPVLDVTSVPVFPDQVILLPDSVASSENKIAVS